MRDGTAHGGHTTLNDAANEVMRFDDAAARRIEQTYLTPDLVRQREVVRAMLAPHPGEHVLDIGSGPGMLAHELAAEVGPSGSVHGVDPSGPMLAIAAQREPAAGAGPVTFSAGDACALGVADGRFDAAVSTQVYEYVADMPAALAAARRALRPGGRLLVLDTDWDSLVWACSDDQRMRRVLRAWEQHLVDPHLPRRLGALLEQAGFTIVERSALPVLNAGYDTNTFSAGLIGLITAFVPGRDGVSEADARAWAEDLTGLGRDYFFSLNRYLFLAVA